MTDLIRRLEEAKEGSRELDCDIFAALNPDRPDLIAILTYVTIPHYTTNLQDAVSAFPDGMEWFVDHVDGRTIWTLAEKAGVREGFTGKHDSSPAIAACIANLKARKELYRRAQECADVALTSENKPIKYQSVNRHPSRHGGQE